MPREIPDCPKKPNSAVEPDRRYETEVITSMAGVGDQRRDLSDGLAHDIQDMCGRAHRQSLYFVRDAAVGEVLG
jgi:hypothetical protein